MGNLTPKKFITAVPVCPENKKVSLETLEDRVVVFLNDVEVLEFRDGFDCAILNEDTLYKNGLGLYLKRK